MRNAALLLGTLVTVACSVDHLVLASLDEAVDPNVGGSSASAGMSGLSANAAGDVNLGGSPLGGSAGLDAAAQGGRDRMILASGGSNVDIRISGDAGATSELVCSCLGTQAQVCGSDGITYAACTGEGACIVPTIACWHACPCLAGESADMDMVSWFSMDCAPAVACADGVICMTFSNVTPDQRICTPAGN
jgi:hypothetical protein